MKLSAIKHTALCSAIVATTILAGMSCANAAGRFRAVGARETASGRIATGHVSGGRNAEGQAAINRGGTVIDANGATHYGGGAVRGPEGVAGRREVTKVGTDGSVERQERSGWKGINGGGGSGSSSYIRNPDGSASSSHQNSGHTAAGGTYDSTGSYSRDANGNVTGTSQTNVSGKNGTRDSSTTTSNGATTHDTTITNAATGNTYSGQTTFSNGQITHTQTCKNSAGAVIQC